MAETTVGKRRSDVGYGEGQVELELDDEVLLDEEELTRRLVETFKSPSYVPPRLPTVAVELMELSQRADSTFDDFVGLLEQDAMLAGEVLKLVRSPIYAGQTNITSLKQALVRIGVKNLRDIVVEASLNARVFRCQAYDDTMNRLRRHSAMTAYLCRIICRYTSIEADYSFLCGLLHDVGIAGTLIALAEASKTPPDLIAIWPAVDRVHAEAATQIAAIWDLPAELQMVIGAHHQVLMEGYPHPMAATVCLANQIADERGYGLTAAEEDDDGSVAAACLQSHTVVDVSTEMTLTAARDALALSDKQLGLIEQEAENLPPIE